MRERLARGWQAYWFGVDARLSIEVLRIALAIAGLSVWWQRTVPSYSSLIAGYPEGAYTPLGILRLLGSAPPPAWFFEVWKLVGLLALVCMGIGLFTRAAIAVSTIAMLLVAGLRDGFNAPWSHSFAPYLLAQLAFLFAPAGRALSVDAALRRLRGRPALPALHSAWCVLLVQIAVALPFFNAVHWKLRRSGLAWALSDSLRNHILTAFDWAGEQRSALADLVVRHEAAWKAVALANLASQMLPIAACFLVRRPRLRALLGLFYVLEVIGLDLLMGLPNYHWLPLAVVFVDWDYFIARIRRREPEAPPAEPPPRRATIYIAGFLLANLVIAFTWRGLDVRLGLYPLSQYQMFSTVRAKKPYDRHQSFELDGLRFEVDPATRNRAEVERLLDRRFRKYHPAREQRRVKRLLDQAMRIRRLRSMTLRFAILVAPAYPAEPELIPHEVGILGRYRDGVFQSALGRAGGGRDGRFTLEPAVTGLALPDAPRFTYILDQDPTARPLEVEPAGDGFRYRVRAPGRHIVLVDIAGENFVVAEARHSAGDVDNEQRDPQIR